MTELIVPLPGRWTETGAAVFVRSADPEWQVVSHGDKRTLAKLARRIAVSMR
jgi:hypothetical protein